VFDIGQAEGKSFRKGVRGKERKIMRDPPKASKNQETAICND